MSRSDYRLAMRSHWGAIVDKVVRSPPVLMYHGVGKVDEDPFGLFVSTELFAEQMRAIRALGLRGVSLGEFGDALSRGKAGGLVGLTFDDGYRDVLTLAAPILERHGFTATMFAVSSLLGGENVWDLPPRRRLISEADIRELQRHGWEIGAHGVTHARLTELDAEQVRHEVITSRAALATVIGAEPRCFCYPYGSVNAETVNAVQAAGYSYACAVRPEPGLLAHLAMPRIGVAQRDRWPRFVAKLLLRGG